LHEAVTMWVAKATVRDFVVMDWVSVLSIETVVGGGVTVCVCSIVPEGV